MVLPYFIVIFVAAASAILIPLEAPGPYSVGSRIQALTDESRWDPYAPDEKRRVLLSAYVPVGFRNESCPDGEVVESYMPPETARVFGLQAEAMGLSEGIFEGLQMKLCRFPEDAASVNEAKFPVLLFSPGRGASRLMYSAMARALASHGYVVVLVDHAHDATIIEFPDGSVVTGVAGVGNQTELEQSNQVRQKDISFIVDKLQDTSTAEALVGFTPVDRVFVFGHSIGGATTASSLLADDRIFGGINFDGDMLGSVLTAGLDQPLFLISKPGGREQGPSWNQTWENLRGPSMMMQVAGTTHMSFSDMPLLATLRDVPEDDEAAIDAALGTIDGKRIAAVVVELTVAVLEFVFEGVTERLCRVQKAMPEVAILETKGIDCSYWTSSLSWIRCY